MNADMLFNRINSLERKHSCYVLAHAWGAMQSRMDEKDLQSILTCLEYYEEQEAKESKIA